MRFGEYLVGKGKVDERELEDAIKAQQESHVVLGVLATREGVLNKAQLSTILDHQRMNGGLFGEIAIELKLINKDDLTFLLDLQKIKRDLLGDILVLYGVISRDDMENELQRFHEIEGAKIEWEINVKSLRILVVDDEEVIRNILNQFLERSGHNVKTVDNGTDAIKMVESEVFDLVLCDLGLPDVFGYDVVSAINRIEKRPKIGIISGWSVDRVSDKDMKVDFYLKKPFKHSELIKHIDELFVYN